MHSLALGPRRFAPRDDGRPRSVAAGRSAGGADRRRRRAGARAGLAVDVARRQARAARVAREVRGDLAAALAVAHDARRALGRRVVAVAPLHQRDDRRPQVDALLAEAVLEALRALLVAMALEQSLVGQALEAVGQHIAGDAEVALEVVEAAHAEEGVADDEQRPPDAEHLEGAGDGAVLLIVRAGQHQRSGASVAELVA